jgi:hypothetical protein
MTAYKTTHKTAHKNPQALRDLWWRDMAGVAGPAYC